MYISDILVRKGYSIISVTDTWHDFIQRLHMTIKSWERLWNEYVQIVILKND